MSAGQSPEKPTASMPVGIVRPLLNSSGDSSLITPTISPAVEHKFLVPSPMVTRRNRTCSASRHATEGPIHHGVCTLFSRSKGHGFIQDSATHETIFMHVSDIESDYVPLPGDRLAFKLARIPPKNEKFQAVEVMIESMCEGGDGDPHVRWSGDT